jgi:hypothetical protein
MRVYMGYSRLFESSNPDLENAFTAIDNLSSSGPPNGDLGATEARILVALAGLNAIDAALAQLGALMLATEVSGEVVFDAIRQDRGLRMQGRALINQLAIALSLAPVVDYFGPANVSGDIGFTLHGNTNYFDG